MDNSVTAQIGRDKYSTELTTSRHQLFADEPEDKGGSNVGPAPGEFLRLSLASCTAITLRMYADRKEWDVEKIVVQVSSKAGENQTTFTRQVDITGNINDAQRKRLLEIANACPIHKVLTMPIIIDTDLNILLPDEI
ncbi:MAG TPA: OsmC family protein [Ohtaekwangia sp.]|nr:OsmC family protein [Ohtaekwangia sp.]